MICVTHSPLQTQTLSLLSPTPPHSADVPTTHPGCPNPMICLWFSPCLVSTFKSSASHVVVSACKIYPEFGHFPPPLSLSPGPGYHHFLAGDALVSLGSGRDLGLSIGCSPCGSQRSLTPLSLNIPRWILTALGRKSELTPQPLRPAGPGLTCRLAHPATQDFFFFSNAPVSFLPRGLPSPCSLCPSGHLLLYSGFCLRSTP